MAKEEKLGIDHDLIALELEKAHLELSKLKELEKQNEPYELMQHADLKDFREKRLHKEKFAANKAIQMVSAKKLFVDFNVLSAAEKLPNT